MASLATYLHDGITWTRLKSIAQRPEELGGVGHMNPEDFVSFFRKKPPKLIDERPELQVDFLRWLIPKRQDCLRRVLCVYIYIYLFFKQK